MTFTGLSHRDTPGYKALRQGRMTTAGSAYHLRTSVCARDDVVLDGAVARAVVRSLLDWQDASRFLLIALVVIGIAGIRYIYGKPSLASVTIDEGTHSIVMIWSHYSKEPTTRRIPFDDIGKVEYLTGSTVIGGNFWTVSVYTQDGEKVELNHSTKEPLKGYAETVAAKTGAPYVPINNTRGSRMFFGQEGG